MWIGLTCAAHRPTLEGKQHDRRFPSFFFLPAGFNLSGSSRVRFLGRVFSSLLLRIIDRGGQFFSIRLRGFRMNIRDAAHATVHDYPGGSESLGPRLGMHSAVLRGKVSLNGESRNVLGLMEASRMMALTDDHRILHALCMEHSFAAVPLSYGPIGDLSILERITTIWKEVGDVGQTVQRILADSKVEKKEVAVLRDEIQEAIEALLSLQMTLEGLEE